MVEKFLISKDDVAGRYPMAEIPQGRFDMFVLQAQDLDLKPVLNPALYYDFITKYDSTGDAMYASYQTLLNGGTYTYGGQTIEYVGIKPMLCAFTMARFLPQQQVNVTRYSVVNKLNGDRSEPIDQARITYLVNNMKADGAKYQNDIVQFLSNNTTTYPLYNTAVSDPKSQGGLNFFSSSTRNRKPFGWFEGVYYP